MTEGGVNYEEFQEKASETVDIREETALAQAVSTISVEQEPSQLETKNKSVKYDTSQKEASETSGTEQNTSQADDTFTIDVDHESSKAEAANRPTLGIEQGAYDTETTETIQVEQELSQKEAAKTIGVQQDVLQTETEDTISVEQDTFQAEAAGDASNGDAPMITDFFNMQKPKMTIYWFDVMPNDQLIMLSNLCERNSFGNLCERNSFGSLLSLYSAESKDTDRRMLSELRMFASISADTLNDRQVIVAEMGENKLQIVNIDHDNLTKTRVIYTRDTSPIYVQKCSDSSVLILPWQHGCYRILDLLGNVLKDIAVGIDITTTHRMLLSADRGQIYTVIYRFGRQDIVCFNLKGEVIFRYTHPDRRYLGLATDQDGASYVSTGKLDRYGQSGPLSIIKLSPAGQLLRQIDIKERVPLKCIGNKLYFTDYHDPSVIQYVHV